MSPGGPNQLLNQTQPAFSQSAQKLNASNASSKAFQYLQKKGNLQSNTGASAAIQPAPLTQDIINSGDRANNHLIKRIASGRKQLGQSTGASDQNNSQR